MLFNSTTFLVFFPIVVLIYLILPAKLRTFWLLVTSYFFYMSWSPKYSILLLFSTVATWLCGLEIEKYRAHKKMLIFLCLAANLLILFYFKYLNFTIGIFDKVFNADISTYNIILPVGISFYTFKALGYTIDVYREDVKAEHNFIRYALFVSFFPQLVAGPIERSGHMLRQICDVPFWSRKKILNAERIRNGIILMIWGLFLKTVIADRVAILVDNVFNNYAIYGSTALVMAAVGFGIQIYCDFSSYSIIAIGASKVMGFEVMENFVVPYMAGTVTEFWRRWHISLSSWFRDYLYIPLGGNRKGKLRKYINVLITFTLSGLWHGANLTFIFWGFLHGIYNILESIFKPLGKKIREYTHMDTENVGYKCFRALFTFILVDFAWIFFRADSLEKANAYIYQMFMERDPWVLSSDTIFTYGLSANEMFILAFALVILFIVDLIRVRKNEMLDVWLGKQWLVFRVVFVITILITTIIFGIYGPGFDSKQFIYLQF